MKKLILIIIGFFLLTAPTGALAQDDTTGFVKRWLPGTITGVIRTKYEQNTSNGKGRFDVRNARFGMKGNVGKYFGYKFEIDFCDEGKI
ncbi:MAG TPA: porin, partial [Bacteroidales bacterium]|nr:porin [Bacteroidales bacterium]